jgi:hypothetical protein
MPNLRQQTKWYHATSIQNLEQILQQGKILPNKGYVFLSSTPEDAGRFLLYHGHTEWAVFKIHRRDIDVSRLQSNPAYKNCPIGFSEDLVTAIYDKPIQIHKHKLNTKQDIPNIVPHWARMRIVPKPSGTQAIGSEIVDYKEFNRLFPTQSKQFKDYFMKQWVAEDIAIMEEITSKKQRETA